MCDGGVMGVGGVWVCRGSCLRRNDGFRWVSGVGSGWGEGRLRFSRGIGMTGKGGGWGRQRWRVGGAWAFPRSYFESLSMSGTTTRRKLKGENSCSHLSVGWRLRFLAGPRNDMASGGWGRRRWRVGGAWASPRSHSFDSAQGMLREPQHERPRTGEGRHETCPYREWRHPHSIPAQGMGPGSGAGMTEGSGWGDGGGALCVRREVMGVGGMWVCRGSCLRRNDEKRGAGITEVGGLAGF